LHAPYGIVDSDGPLEPPQKLGPLELKLLGTYPGSMGRYLGVYQNMPMLTVEFERSGIMPPEKDIEQIWIDILEWLDKEVLAANVSDGDSDKVAAMQSLRHEKNDKTNGESKKTVIDQKAGD